MGSLSNENIFNFKICGRTNATDRPVVVGLWRSTSSDALSEARSRAHTIQVRQVRCSPPHTSLTDEHEPPPPVPLIMMDKAGRTEPSRSAPPAAHPHYMVARQTHHPTPRFGSRSLHKSPHSTVDARNAQTEHATKRTNKKRFETFAIAISPCTRAGWTVIDKTHVRG